VVCRRACSLKTLAQKAYAEGFRFRRSGNKIPVTTLHKILRNRIYVGDFDYAGKTYQGIHEPLVDRATWQKVQEILDGRQEKKHRKVIHDFTFSGAITCGHCGCSLVGEIKKGRYIYYHCTGYRGRCPEPYTRQEELISQFAARLRDLVVAPEVREWLQEELATNDQNERIVAERELRRDQAELDRLQGRLELLYDDRLESRIDATTYDRRSAEVRQQQNDIRRRIYSRETEGLPPVQEAVDFIALTSRTAELFCGQSAVEQAKLVRLVVQNATWKAGELRMCFREPFSRMALSNSATHTKQNGIGPSIDNFDNWRRERDSNPWHRCRCDSLSVCCFRPLSHLWKNASRSGFSQITELQPS
jgi:site-specific DNA recombinase